LTLFTEDENAACRIAERLLEGGASCTAADDSLITVFHRAVLAGKLALVRTFLRVDPNSKTAIDFLPQIGYQNAISPLVSAIGLGDRAMSALLIASGASVSITEQMFDKSWDARQSLGLKNAWRPSKQGNQFLADTMMPVEVSLASRNDLAFPLIQLGADLNLGLRYDHRGYNANEEYVCLFPLLSAIASILPLYMRNY
jgi:ankyrin repeat protein